MPKAWLRSLLTLSGALFFAAAGCGDDDPGNGDGSGAVAGTLGGTGGKSGARGKGVASSGGRRSPRLRGWTTRDGGLRREVTAT